MTDIERSLVAHAVLFILQDPWGLVPEQQRQKSVAAGPVLERIASDLRRRRSGAGTGYFEPLAIALDQLVDGAGLPVDLSTPAARRAMQVVNIRLLQHFAAVSDDLAQLHMRGAA